MRLCRPDAISHTLLEVLQSQAFHNEITIRQFGCNGWFRIRGSIICVLRGLSFIQLFYNRRLDDRSDDDIRDSLLGGELEELNESTDEVVDFLCTRQTSLTP